MALILGGCGNPQAITSVPAETLTPADIVAGCCDGAGSYPDWVVEFAAANDGLLLDIGRMQLYPGRLAQRPEAMAVVQGALRPLDVVAMYSPNRVSGHLISGHFTHLAIYLGSERQLREEGLWDLPAVRPWQEDIESGRVFLEGNHPAVQLSPVRSVLNTNAVVILRPPVEARATALAIGLAQVGVPFDIRFDADDGCRLFCSELLDRMYPAIPLPRTTIIGRETIVVDAVVAGSVSGTLPFDLVGYVAATPGGGASVLSARDLAWDIRLNWPDRPPHD